MALTKAKKRLVVASISIGALFMFGFKKYKRATEVMDNIKVRVKSISNFKLKLTSLKFNAVFAIKNPTNIDFGATLTSLIRIKQIRVFSLSGIHIGSANTGLYKLYLPANSEIELPEVQFEIDTKKALNELLSNTNAYLNNDFSNLTYKMDIEVFGNTITLDANQ